MLPRTRAALATAAVIAVAGVSINAVAAPAPAASTSQKGVTALRALSARIARAINTARAERGLAPLHVSRRLRAAAAFHSFDMALHGFFAHNSFDGTSASARLARFYPSAGYLRWDIGETILWYSPGVGATAAVEEWLSSPEHRVILLAGNYREIGVSAVHEAAAPGTFDGDEVTLVTADFGARAH